VVVARELEDPRVIPDSLLSRDGPDATTDVLADDAQHTVVRIHVLPAQRRRVAKAQAREGKRGNQCEVLWREPFHVQKEGAEEVGHQGVVVLLLVLGKGNAKRWISRQIERLHRVARHGPQDAEPSLDCLTAVPLLLCLVVILRETDHGLSTVA
jgi:hypothetical protein